jgi:RNA polymerase sporulation-specific sigma factor
MDVICVDDDMFDNVAGEEMRGLLIKKLAALEDREREIIVMRYGLNGSAPMPQREVAAVCGISRSYVSSDRNEGIEKLRAMLE